jgi:hypothetical protein
MHFKSILSFGLLVGSVLASPAPVPQASGAAVPVGKALSDITTALQGLKTKVGAWNGDVVEASNVLLDAQDLLGVITSATKTVSALQVLPLNEAVTILQPANLLIKEAQGTVDGLISKKSAMDKAGLSSVVKDTLTKFKTGAGEMITAVMKILPDNVKTVGESIGKQINTALDKGLAAYA